MRYLFEATSHGECEYIDRALGRVHYRLDRAVSIFAIVLIAGAALLPRAAPEGIASSGPHRMVPALSTNQPEFGGNP